MRDRSDRIIKAYYYNNDRWMMLNDASAHAVFINWNTGENIKNKYLYQMETR